MLSGDKVKGRK